MKDNFKAAIPAMIIVFLLYACVGTLDYQDQKARAEASK